MWVRTCSDCSDGETAKLGWQQSLSRRASWTWIGSSNSFLMPDSAKRSLSVHPFRSLLALRTINLKRTMNLLKSLSLCVTSYVPQVDSHHVFLWTFLQPMALVMSQFHEPHPRGNHSLVLLKQPPAVVESYSDCATLFLCILIRFWFFFLTLWFLYCTHLRWPNLVQSLHY